MQLKFSLSMRKLLFLIFSSTLLVACDPHLFESVMTPSPTSVPLTNAEVISGLKDALRVGAENAVGITSREGGFNSNAVIRIPFPEEAIRVRNWAMQNGLSTQVSNFESNLNKAAERAAKEAVPVFVNAITSMSIEDGFTILRGDSLAATTFLRQRTTGELVTRFRPTVDQVIDEIKLTSYWDPIASAYNATTLFTGQQQVNTDLGAYVTDKALQGLFYYVGVEEKKIRRDPKARVTDILVRVFGSLDRR